MNATYKYENPLGSRYATEEMSAVFSSQNKYITWRKLWISLAKAQRSLGLKITSEMINELETNLNHIDFDRVAYFEKKCRHEVMAHLEAYREQCPKAKGILHLGATSAFVMDNTDLIQMKQALSILKNKFLANLSILSDFATQNASLPCMGYTHFQPAQPTTVGKRAAMWLQDLLWDFNALENFLDELPFLGNKGATGTQASFLEIFSKDHEKVKRLEQTIARDFAFSETLIISGQTYPRKIDFTLLSVLSSLATSAHKIAGDIRLLCHLKEIEEPFEEQQIGSSAMPYKRNPIRCERLCSLSRYLLSLWENGAYTSSLQWLERTLDDSAARRIYIPEAFLTADALLNLLGNVLSGLIVNKKVIQKNLQKELPFLATETILMQATKQGKDRGKVHAALRKHALDVAKAQKEGEEKDLLSLIEKDPEIGLSKKELDNILEIKHFIGRAPEQVEEFIQAEINPLLKKHSVNLSNLTQIEI